MRCADVLHELRRPCFALQLIERALAWRLVRPPAQKLRAVTEALACDVVVTHLDDELRPQRLPFGRALRAPPARRAGRPAREAGRLPERLEPLRQRPSGPSRDRGSKADVVEQAPIVVKTEQERPDFAPVARVAEAADDAV